MNDTVRMSVSSMTRHGDKKAIYVLFTDGNKSAEFTLPGCGLLNNKGFDDEEIKHLKDYVDNEQDYIFALAKEVNPMKAFMGDDSGKGGQ